MKQNILTAFPTPFVIVGFALMASGCASLNAPSLALPKAPALNVPDLKLPTVPNPFAKKPALETPAITHQVPQDVEKSRGFQFNQLSNPLTSGPGMRAMLTGTTPNEGKAKASFAAAQQAYQQAQAAKGEPRTKLFKEAGKNYARAAERFVDPSLKEDAMFLAGESYFFADEYPDSVEAFGILAKNYPTTRYMDIVDGRRFKIADFWFQSEKKDSKYNVLPNFVNERRPVVDTYGNAIKLLDRIRYDNPSGKLADDATMAAAVAHFERERYGEANELFDDLRKNFPSSDHQFRAHLLGLKTKLQIYQGPDYDGTVLDEAQDIVKRMRVVFPDESREQEEYLAGALKDVRLKMADREYAVAKFYDNRSEYDAAKVYYGKVRTEYQDTNLAIESEKRLAQIETYPETDDSTMDWLVNAFPKEVDPQPLLARESPAPLMK